MRDSILTSADILSIINFSGPVVSTLRQVLERYDGTGAPQGLKGAETLITARIIAVANAFVAMVSPRAHRAHLNFTDSLERLQADSGTAFDGQVVTVLTNYVTRNEGQLTWIYDGPAVRHIP